MKHQQLFVFNLIVILIFSSHMGDAQSIFSQQDSKAKLMLAQILLYQTRLYELKQAYSITGSGLNTAQQIKNGTYDLHANYIHSLAQVAPVVKNDPRGKAILVLSDQVNHVFTAEITWQQKEKALSPAEINYLRQVYSNLVQKMQADLDELTQVLTPGKLQLTDQERLNRLDHLYESMKDKQAFSGAFTSKCRALATSRERSQQEKQQLKKLYGVQ